MASINISVKDVDQVKTLTSLLAKYSDSLPEELVESLHKFVDCKTFEFSNEDFIKSGASFDTYRLIVNGVDKSHENGVVSVNPILKRVTRHAYGEDLKPIVDENEWVYLHEYPESLSIGDDKITCVEW